MKLKQQYKELLQLKKEINQRLEKGTGFTQIKDLMLYLAQDKAYSKLKGKENQLIMLDCFLNLWLREKKRLPDLGIKADIFYKVSSLDDVEQKYQRIKHCGLRIENAVPNDYIEQALEWLIEDRISGMAIGTIIVKETKKREENVIYIARCLRQKADSINALLLIQYANEAFPGQEKLLLEEADIWLEGNQFERALEAIEKIEKPSSQVEKLTNELRKVAKNDR
ncbi:MAG: crossover junction endonuclease [Lachnospiraceae bacterium]|nr:crossover junction endonuclease [Lachnospiraceae bacterium]